MPDATILEQHGPTTLPPDAPPVTWDPKELAGAFTRVFDSFKISSTGEAVKYTTAVSELMGWVARSDVSTLKGDELAVAQFIKHYVNLLSDAVDLAEASPLHEVRPRRLTEDELTEYARTNQQLVQDYFYLSGQNATDEQKQHASDFFNIIMALPSGEMLKDIVASQLRGAQAQAGLMRLLSENGWRVFVPDVTNPKEVALWDVDGDVDLVAYQPGSKKLLLINTKGRTSLEDDPEHQQRHVAEIVHYPLDNAGERAVLHKEITKQVNQLLADEGQTKLPTSYSWLRVTIPTSREYLDAIGVITDQHIRTTILDQLSEMS